MSLGADFEEKYDGSEDRNSDSIHTLLASTSSRTSHVSFEPVGNKRVLSIHYVPDDYNERDLKAFFGPVCEIEQTFFESYNASGGICRIAYVVCPTAKLARDALAILDASPVTTVLGDVKMNLNVAGPSENPFKEGYNPPDRDWSALNFKNFPPEHEDKDLLEIFSDYGTVKYIKLFKRNEACPNGEGVVIFSNWRGAALAATDLSGSTLGESQEKLKLILSQPQLIPSEERIKKWERANPSTSPNAHEPTNSPREATLSHGAIQKETNLPESKLSKSPEPKPRKQKKCANSRRRSARSQPAPRNRTSNSRFSSLDPQRNSNSGSNGRFSSLDPQRNSDSTSNTRFSGLDPQRNSNSGSNGRFSSLDPQRNSNSSSNNRFSSLSPQRNSNRSGTRSRSKRGSGSRNGGRGRGGKRVRGGSRKANYFNSKQPNKSQDRRSKSMKPKQTSIRPRSRKKHSRPNGKGKSESAKGISNTTPGPGSQEKHVDISTYEVAITECCICWDAPRVMAFIPCGHLATCETCCVSWKSDIGKPCPLCRLPVESSIKIYNA